MQQLHDIYFMFANFSITMYASFYERLPSDAYSGEYILTSNISAKIQKYVIEIILQEYL